MSNEKPKSKKWTQEEKDAYRFGGYRYTLQNTDKTMQNTWVDQLPGAFPFPKKEDSIK